MKLHELSREAVGFVPDPAPEPDIKLRLSDPHNPTKDEALSALRSAYRQLLTGKVTSPKGIAQRLIAPAILYLESDESK